MLAFQRFLLRLVSIRNDYSTDLTDQEQFASQKNDRALPPKKQNGIHTDFHISVCVEYYIPNLELLNASGLKF